MPADIQYRPIPICQPWCYRPTKNSHSWVVPAGARISMKRGSLCHLGNTHYILWSTIPPTSCPTRKKKLTLVCFFYFFLRHDQKCKFFFYQIGSIFIKKWAQSAENVRHVWLMEFLFLFFSSDMAEKPVRIHGPKNIVSVALRIQM